MTADGITPAAPDPEKEAVAVRFDPLDPSHYREPHERLAELRRSCPVSKPSEHMAFVASYDDVRSAARDVAHLSNVGNVRLARPGADGPPRRSLALTQLDPPQHTVVRRLLLSAFTPATVRATEPFLEETARRIVRQAHPRGHADLNELLARPIPALAIAHLTGIDEADQADFAEWSAEITANLPMVPLDLPARQSFVAAIERLLRERRADARPKDDLLTRLLVADVRGDDGEMVRATDDDIVGIIFQLIVAGNDTTMRLIANCVHSLLVERSRWERVLADRSLLDVAIEESLRFDSPIQWMMRTCRDPMSLRGVQIDDGDRVLLGVGSANRDDTVFDDPDEFSLDRSNASDHLAFGHGIHLCLGAALGRSETRIAIGALLDAMPDVRLAPGFVYEPVDSAMVRGPKSLLLEWTPNGAGT